MTLFQVTLSVHEANLITQALDEFVDPGPERQENDRPNQKEVVLCQVNW